MKKDKTQCDVKNRTLINLNERSLCPWVYENKKDNHRFPHWRSSVKCTCDKCQPLYGEIAKMKFSSYSCFPVSHRVPILLRGECGNDGYYKWEENYDDINVACVCALTYPHYQHRF